MDWNSSTKVNVAVSSTVISTLPPAETTKLSVVITTPSPNITAAPENSPKKLSKLKLTVSPLTSRVLTALKAAWLETSKLTSPLALRSRVLARECILMSSDESKLVLLADATLMMAVSSLPITTLPRVEEMSKSVAVTEMPPEPMATRSTYCTAVTSMLLPARRVAPKQSVSSRATTESPVAKNSVWSLPNRSMSPLVLTRTESWIERPITRFEAVTSTFVPLMSVFAPLSIRTSERSDVMSMLSDAPMLADSPAKI
mmetsp:Transcript_17734/g.68788  ORF Transcript_17734/g.68788 Transcript_17734/m.68788 type:complete len:257 (-) Transcript_17734:777-1547(-)